MQSTAANNFSNGSLHYNVELRRNVTFLEEYSIFLNFYRYFVSWCIPTLAIFGIIGTTVCLLVLFRRRTAHPGVKSWFIALSIADLFSLIFGLGMFYFSHLVYIFPRSNLIAFRDFRHSDAFACYTLSTLVYTGLLMSSWLQAGISVVRVLTTRSPFKRRAYFNRRSSNIALAVVIITCFVAALLLIVFTVSYEVKKHPSYPSVMRCTTNSRNYFYSSLILKVILPTICLLFSSIMITRSLQKFHNIFSESLGQEHYKVLKRRIQQRQISYILLGMNTTFLLFTLPFEIFKIYYFFNPIRPKFNYDFLVYRIVDKLLNILLYSNNATNWLFYFLLGKRFRNGLLQLVNFRGIAYCCFHCLGLDRLQSVASRHSRRRSQQEPVPTTRRKLGMIGGSPHPTKRSLRKQAAAAAAGDDQGPDGEVGGVSSKQALVGAEGEGAQGPQPSSSGQKHVHFDEKKLPREEKHCSEWMVRRATT